MVTTTIGLSHFSWTWRPFERDSADNPNGKNSLVVLCFCLSCPGIRDVRVNLSISRQSRMGERPEKTGGWHFLEGLLRPLANTSLDAWLAPQWDGDLRLVVWCGHFAKGSLLVHLKPWPRAASSVSTLVMCENHCVISSRQWLRYSNSSLVYLFSPWKLALPRNPSHAEAQQVYGATSICISLQNPSVCRCPWVMARSCPTHGRIAIVLSLVLALAWFSMDVSVWNMPWQPLLLGLPKR